MTLIVDILRWSVAIAACVVVVTMCGGIVFVCVKLVAEELSLMRRDR